MSFKIMGYSLPQAKMVKMTGIYTSRVKSQLKLKLDSKAAIFVVYKEYMA